jgi:uncharacterized protein
MLGEIKNPHGERIDYTFHPVENDAQYVVVIGHGVTGNKDRPFVVALADGLAAAGIPAVRISFSGNGQSEGTFQDSNISKEVDDLGAVLDVLKGHNVVYVGHSMGGAVGVLRASKDDRIKLLVTLAGMVHTKAFAKREFGSVKPGAGFMWDEPACPLSQSYMDDLYQINSVVDKAPHIRVPWLLVHGSEDDVVPIQDSRDIFAKASTRKQFVEIKGANHVFAGEHTPIMVEKVTQWIASH